MGLFGGKKQTAFEIQLNPTRRDKIAERRAAAADRAIAILAREKKKQAGRDALLEKAEAIKKRAQKREDDRAAAEKRKTDAAAKARRAKEPEGRTACTCRKTRIGRDGKCVRCHKKPASGRRR